ncbi:hypothetical protein N7513_004773 [Penicillium frequentans]|uniref:Uncharacterized protein n=1 Tax=Penicillium frequentans TaxID=3151616 RepID=A0AAD6GE91_9EURO|nr:hypothetical protein N7494_006971 [Penicillium glabrum]KAJ5547539.1 hypothetical protein N7513_004773 [Penicillium glabrum]KAJ5556746.1 hypothetical protein N7494_000661 [Penicillium glabrum]
MAAIDSALCLSSKDELDSDGFIYKVDAEAGHRVEEMEVNSIPFASEAGLQFYKLNVLDDPNKRQILNSCFQWFGLGLYRTFGAMPGDYAFRQSDPSSKTESLLIQFWKKGSRVTFWKGSHLEQVPTIKGENNLWRAPRVALAKIGLEPVEIYFEYGGFSIRDTRLFVEVLAGSAITCAVAAEDVLRKWWTPMKLPRSLQRVVSDMEGPTFGMNVTYFDGE